MPGVYVRTLSQLDWLDQEKESLLTIPGSYWLCHKKNIYKFIFRYHRTMRNTTQFSYGRELLKIIRRIIKCHPTQGQQFGTQHLLVTYNCTFWTRQDKMFAVLKFQQRTNAAAFSHAFVLTIRICLSSEHSLFDIKYPIVKEVDASATFENLNVCMDKEKKITKTVIYADKMSPSMATMYQNKKIKQILKYNAINDILREDSKTINFTLQGNVKESVNFHENLDARIKNAATTAEVQFVNKHNTEFHNNIHENKSMNCNVKRYEKNMDSVNHIEKQSLRTIQKINKIETANGEAQETKAIANKIKSKKQNQEIQTIQKCKILSSMKSPLTEIIKDFDEWPLSNRFDFNKNSIGKDNIYTISNKDNLNDNKEKNSETIADPNNVPYQYFIEKEIEDAKHNTRFMSDTFLTIDQPIRKILQTEIKNANENSFLKVIRRSNEFIHTKQKEYSNEIIDPKYQRNDKQHAGTSININNNQSQNNNTYNNNQSQNNNTYNKSYKAHKQKNRESEKKTISDDKILRSSNITDLVMEGLMFTIRQDQDSVAVIEQKTKLEIDEVLENSEKVETKAGGKCLLNSSLLKLENLVTMIDSPYNKDEKHKISHSISNRAYLSPFNIFPTAVCNLDVSYVDGRMDKSSVSRSSEYNATDHLNLYESRWQHQRISSSIKNKINDSYLRSGITMENEQLIEWQSSNKKYEQDRKNKNNKMKKEEKEDIIPEVSQSIFQSEKKNAELQNKDLLMNDIDMKETNKFDTSVKGYYNSLLPCFLSKPNNRSMKQISDKSGFVKLPQEKANIPRIISDKTITIDQMPLALQKVLRHTCKARKFSSTTSNEMLEHEQKLQHMTLIEDAMSKTNVSLEDKYIDPNIASNSLSIEFTVDSKKIKCNKNESCVVVDKYTSKTNGGTCARNIERKNNEAHHISRRSLSSKHNLPKKLQDITEDFYYDMLHVHNKNNAIRQRCLRQKRRSFNNSNDIKNSKIRIEMLKFIQDITEGARVVVKRLNINSKSNLLKNSTLTMCTHYKLGVGQFMSK